MCRRSAGRCVGACAGARRGDDPGLLLNQPQTRPRRSFPAYPSTPAARAAGRARPQHGQVDRDCCGAAGAGEADARCSAAARARSVASVLSEPVRPHGLQPARLLCPRDSPGKNTGVGCYTRLQGVSPTQGLGESLLRLLRWQAGPLPSTHQGSSHGHLKGRLSWEAGNKITTLYTHRFCASWKQKQGLARLPSAPTPTLIACKRRAPLKHTPRPGEVSSLASVIPAWRMDPQGTA